MSSGLRPNSPRGNGTARPSQPAPRLAPERRLTHDHKRSRQDCRCDPDYDPPVDRNRPPCRWHQAPAARPLVHLGHYRGSPRRRNGRRAPAGQAVQAPPNPNPRSAVSLRRVQAMLIMEDTIDEGILGKVKEELCEYLYDKKDNGCV